MLRRSYEISVAHSWSKWNQPVDRSEWHMPAHMVNAYYDPQQNQIVFPAAIFRHLSMTFTNRHQPTTVVLVLSLLMRFPTPLIQMVLPLMRMVVLRDWWTAEDYAAFTARTQKVVDQFEGLDSYGAKINGKLTVSENVADLGGVAVP